VSVTEENYEIWRIWRALGRRHLPYAGGFLDQPADTMDSIILLDGLFSTFEAERNNDG